MNASWFRRAALALGCAGTLALLTACGSGSVVSDLAPKRFLTVGDSFMDVGQSGKRYTVNDGSNNWVQELAAHYGVTVSAASAGGSGHAQGHARIAAADPIGGAPSVTTQIDTLLASTTLSDTDDVVLINGGMHDIVAAVEAGGLSDATTQAVKDAGKALATQVRRVVSAGGKHVVVTGVPLLGDSPWARARNQRDGINALSVAFNDALLIDIADMGATVLYFDSALFFNLINNKPERYSVDNATDPVCTTPDASTCTPSSVVSTDYNRYMYADSLNFTPKVQRNFVDRSYTENAYDKFKNRW